MRLSVRDCDDEMVEYTTDLNTERVPPTPAHRCSVLISNIVSDVHGLVVLVSFLLLRVARWHLVSFVNNIYVYSPNFSIHALHVASVVFRLTECNLQLDYKVRLYHYHAPMFWAMLCAS